MQNTKRELTARDPSMEVNHGSIGMDRRGGHRRLLANRMMNTSGYGVVGNMIIGIIGAVLGGLMAMALFAIPNALMTLNVISIVDAFVSAVVLIAILRAFTRPIRAQ